MGICNNGSLFNWFWIDTKPCSIPHYSCAHVHPLEEIEFSYIMNFSEWHMEVWMKFGQLTSCTFSSEGPWEWAWDHLPCSCTNSCPLAREPWWTLQFQAPPPLPPPPHCCCCCSDPPLGDTLNMRSQKVIHTRAHFTSFFHSFYAHTQFQSK